MWTFRSILIFFINFIMLQCYIKVVFFVLFCFLSEKKPTKGIVAELSPSPFASALPVQHRELILYQGHLFFRTPVILHRPGRSCYVAFSLVKISAAVLSLLTLPFQFSYYINFVF